jgi:hypothetical protein
MSINWFLCRCIIILSGRLSSLIGVITVIWLIVMLATCTRAAHLFICLSLRPQQVHGVWIVLAYFNLWRRRDAIFGTWSAQIFIHNLIPILKCRFLSLLQVRSVGTLIRRLLFDRVKLDADCEFWRFLRRVTRQHKSDLFVQSLSLDISSDDWEGILITYINACLLFWPWII